jgi:hypothetical protein
MAVGRLLQRLPSIYSMLCDSKVVPGDPHCVYLNDCRGAGRTVFLSWGQAPKPLMPRCARKRMHIFKPTCLVFGTQKYSTGLHPSKIKSYGISSATRPGVWRLAPVNNQRNLGDGVVNLRFSLGSAYYSVGTYCSQSIIKYITVGRR